MSADGALYAAHNVIDEQLRWHEDGLASAIAHTLLDRRAESAAEEGDGDQGLAAYAHTLAVAIEEHAGEVAQMIDELFDRVETMVTSSQGEGPNAVVVPSSHMDDHTQEGAVEVDLR